MTTTQILQQEIGLWEAWIEYDQFNTQYFGTLYVFGELRVEPKTQAPGLKKSRSETVHNELKLQAPPSNKGKGRLTEVWYSEPITSLQQYSSICIFSGKEKIAEINEIEILI